MKQFCEICHYSDILEIRKRLNELTGDWWVQRKEIGEVWDKKRQIFKNIFHEN